MRINFNEEELMDAFEFLDGLRESGVTNMWGAPAYVEKRFPDWGGDKAGKAFLLWKETFVRDDGRDSLPGDGCMEDRVLEALTIVAHEVP